MNLKQRLTILEKSQPNTANDEWCEQARAIFSQYFDYTKGKAQRPTATQEALFNRLTGSTFTNIDNAIQRIEDTY